jgi:hypothetical protein
MDVQNWENIGSKNTINIMRAFFLRNNIVGPYIYRYQKPKKMNPSNVKKGILLILILNVQQVWTQELPAYLPQEGLIGWWPFNGNVMDESGNGFHAENKGANLTTDRYGDINRAYEFNGSSYLSISHNDSLNFSIEDSYSMSMWFLVNQSHQAGSLIEKWNGSGPYPYTIRVNNTGSDSHIAAVRYIGGFPQNYERAHAAFIDSINWKTDSGFHHIVAVFQPSDLKIYFNGTLVVIDSTRLLQGEIKNNLDITIGRRGNSTDRFFRGKIDDIGIWNRALSAEEAKQLFTGKVETQILCRDVPTVELFCTDIPRYAPIYSGCNLEITPNSNALGGEIPGFTYGGFFNGHHYYVYNEPTNWTTGDSVTRANGGYLTCIGSEEENAFVAGLTSNNIWIGFYRNPETCEYQWVNCEEVAYTKWATSEPNNQPCGEPYVQIINGCSSNRMFWNNLGNNSANGNCHSNMVPIMEVDPSDYLPNNPDEDGQGIEEGTDNWNIYFEDSLTLENVLTVQPDSSYQLENLGTLAEVDDCGEGSVIRSYRVFSANEGNDLSDTCSMTVNFSAVHHYNILVPEDQVVTTCGNLCTNEALLIDFNDCELSNSGFFPVNLDNPDGSISANITDNGFDGCGVSINRPTGLVSEESFGYGTYTLRARSGSSIANQGFSLLVSEEDYSDRAIVADIRQKGTDDDGWAFWLSGEKVAEGPGNSVPTNYPDWYIIQIRITPDSLSFSINNNVMYQTSDLDLERICGRVLIGAFANSLYDDFEFIPYQENGSLVTEEISKLEVEHLGCDMVNVSFSDRILPTEIGACYLVERKYRMINWCEFDGEGSPWVLLNAEEVGGPYRAEVEYQSSNESINVDDLTVIHFYNEMGVLVDSLVFGAYQEGTVESHTFLKSTESLDVPFAPGFFEYTQKIEVFDQAPPIIQEWNNHNVFSNAQSQDDCLGRIQKEWSVIDSCLIATDWQIVSAGLDLNVSTTTEEFVSDQNILESLTKLDLYTLQIDAEVPLGQHAIEIAIADLCGNTATYHFRYSVVDSLPPIPICHTDLEVSLENLEEFPLPSVEVSTSSLLLSAGMDCSGVTPSAKAIKWDGSLPLNSENSIYLDLRGLEGPIEINFLATERSGIFHNIIIPGVDTFAENSGVTTLVLEGGQLYGPCIPFSSFSRTNLYIGDEVVPSVRNSGTKTNQSIVCEEGGDDWEDMVLTVDTGKFIRVSTLDLLQMEAGFNQTLSENLIFDCREVGEQMVLVLVNDEAGNMDYCLTNIQISDSQDYCEEIAFISGIVTSQEDHPVTNVEVSLNSEAISKTDLIGSYHFQDLIQGNDYTVIPSSDGAWLNGVTTQDLLMITKHILVVENLTTPYQLLAADVDGSGYISTYDIVQLRQLILQNKRDLQTNKSWRFIPADFEFTDPSNPWIDSIPENIHINNLQGYHQADFIGIKIGDVNLSVFEGIRPRSTRSAVIETEWSTFPEGITQIKFRLQDKSIEGFQMALDFGKMNLKSIEYSSLKAENFGKTRIEEELLLISWNGEVKDSTLFSLNFVTQPNLNPMEELRLLDTELRSEAYYTDGEIGSIVFKEKERNGFRVYPNFPNPFKEDTQFQLSVPFAGSVEFRIWDSSGRMLHLQNEKFERGIYTLSVSKEQLGEAGVYYYSLKFDGIFFSERMILIE